MNRQQLSSEVIPAGAFSDWLAEIRTSLAAGEAMDVPCGDCTACCRSFRFIHIAPGDDEALCNIPGEMLVDAPGLPGWRLMGYCEDGTCPMMQGGGCTIYTARPFTCQQFDCRVFAAAGIEAGSADDSVIRQAKRWRFDYPTERDRVEHQAVLDATQFIRENAPLFPGGRVPSEAGQLAILALKVYPVFLDCTGVSRHEIARRVVSRSQAFDSGAHGDG